MKRSASLIRCSNCDFTYYQSIINLSASNFDYDCPYCTCSVTVEKTVEIEIKEPRYRLVMSGANHQFQYSKCTFSNRKDAELRAFEAKAIWGHPCEVEEIP